ncbi:50S ribosomal protein L24 [Mangrovivirga sp. M17]|uniref:Large ribosomal subunit protein uL24 n=2 Tax=Mangrovivirga TaxID=2858886 RepID=A0A4D7K3N4_9BACT|nr:MULTISPECIES: 50S ribosomal protein L24 [Mangrovivirga]MCX2745031.1 50S ribosomal protein L24 [Mangrovivirga halotolerans]QCK14038.1 50S ribosomal protein L24 [Mangrovivirga cuniculi]
MKNAHKTNKFHIRKGDTVKVIAGNQNGKTGQVLEVIPSTYRAIVEGVNMVTKHVKPSATKPEGGIEKVEAPIHMSNLMLVDPATGEPTRVGRKVDENGKLQRYSKKTGEVIKNG